MAAENFNSRLEAAYARVDADEARVAHAKERIENAHNPFGRIIGRVALWVSQGDLNDSIENATIAEEMQGITRTSLPDQSIREREE